MSKISQTTAIFIVLLALVVIFGLFIRIPIDMIKQAQEPKVCGLYIQFANETTEPEVKTILENNNMTMNYTIVYDSHDMLKRYYIIVDQDKRTELINQLKKDENLTYKVEITKGNYSIIVLPEEFIPDEKFLSILRKNKLPLNKSILCSIRFGDGSTDWISEKDGIRIKKELETNEKILFVYLSYIEGKL